MTTATGKGRGRGFASMTRERNRQLAVQGGKTSWVRGTAHRWTSEEARAAGRKGGRISRRRSRATSQTRKTEEK